MIEKQSLILAEDDEMLASLLKYRLEKAGFRVKWAADGRAVKAMLQTGLPDLLIFDIMMPYFSGIELVDYVRNELAASTPLIVVSTAGNEVNVLNAFDLGADDFIAKPVSPSELIVRVKKLLIKSTR